jgi:hypothetical protein
VAEADVILWTAEETTDGRVTFRVGRDGTRLVAEFVGVGRLEADADGTWSRFAPEDGVSAEHVAKLERGLIAALVAHARHQLAFHASAAERGGRAIACLGASQAGKSTAVAELCTRGGFALLADDAVIVRDRLEGFDVVPTEDAHWLLGTSRVALGLGLGQELKARVAPRAAATNPAKLVAICSLVFDDTLSRPKVEMLHGGTMLATLAAAAIRFVVDEPSRQVHEFQQLDALSKVVDVYELRRPRDLRRLAQTGDLLEGLLTR